MSKVIAPFDRMTRSELKEYFYRKHYHRPRPKRYLEDELSKWSDWKHIDFFETMTYLEIKYQSKKWNGLENKPLEVINETTKAIEVRVIGTKTLTQWIPKFLLIKK